MLSGQYVKHTASPIVKHTASPIESARANECMCVFETAGLCCEAARAYPRRYRVLTPFRLVLQLPIKHAGPILNAGSASVACRVGKQQRVLQTS